MPHRFLYKNPDVTSVILAHLAAIGVTLTQAEQWLKIVSLLLAIGYGAWKWQHEYKKAKNEKDK